MEAIRVEGVSKSFRLHSDMPQSVKERLLRLGRSSTRMFNALNVLDLSIGTGETVGVMGHNGSGACPRPNGIAARARRGLPS